MEHLFQGGDVWYCVAGGVAVGAALALGYKQCFADDAATAACATTTRCGKQAVTVGDHTGSSIWSKAFKESGTPGFTVRGPPELSTLKDEAAKANGVDVFLEIWEAGTSEPPHSHPGDDATVVRAPNPKILFWVVNMTSFFSSHTHTTLSLGFVGADLVAVQVVEGKMVIQFYKGGAKDGAPVTLVAGQTGYIESSRVCNLGINNTLCDSIAEVWLNRAG